MEFEIVSNQFEYVLLGVFLVVVIIVGGLIVIDVMKLRASMQDLSSEAVSSSTSVQEVEIERVQRPESAQITTEQMEKRIKRMLAERRRIRGQGYARFGNLPESYASDPVVTINAGISGFKGADT